MPQYTRTVAWLLTGIVAFIFALGVIPYRIQHLPKAPAGPLLTFPSNDKPLYFLEAGDYQLFFDTPPPSEFPTYLYYEHVSRIGTVRDSLDLNQDHPILSIDVSGQYRFSLPGDIQCSFSLFSPQQQQELKHRQFMFYLVIILAAIGTLSLLLSAWFHAQDRSHHLAEAIKTGEIFKQ